MADTPFITVSGRLASGTTTVANHLEDLGFEVVSGGDIFRQQAQENGYTLEEYTALAEEDDTIDRELDTRLLQIAEDHAAGERNPGGHGLVIESRISGWIASDYADLTIYLDAPLEDRLARVSNRDETIEEARAREQSEAIRYRHLYGIDMSNLSRFDLVVDTATIDEDTMTSVVERAAKQFI